MVQNNVILVGRLVDDPKKVENTKDIDIVRFRMAVDKRRKKDDGSDQQQTNFFNCVAFRQTATFLGNYATKGRLIGVNGSIDINSNGEGDERKYYTEIVVDDAQLLDKKPEGA